MVSVPADMKVPEFVEACHEQDKIEWWIDILREGTVKEKKIKILTEVDQWMKKKNSSQKSAEN